jgi:hypothetical protein
MHLTLVQQALEQPGVPEEVLRAGRRNEDALLLGAILPDLPYHARFFNQLARHLSGSKYLHSEWGHVVHTRRTGRFAVSLLAHLDREHPAPDDAERLLALTAGYICHHAVDRLGHPRVQELVGRRLKAGEPHIVLHSRIERYQSLLYHLDLLGVEIPGTPFPRDLTARCAGASLAHARLEDLLWEAVRSTYLETHGHTPSRKEVDDWIWGITAYGALFSSPMGRRERLERPADEIRQRWYKGDGVDLETCLHQSLKLTVQGWQAAVELLRAPRITAQARQAFLETVPDIDLETGY